MRRQVRLKLPRRIIHTAATCPVTKSSTPASTTRSTTATATATAPATTITTTVANTPAADRMDRCHDGLGPISTTTGHRLERSRSGNAVIVPNDEEHGGHKATPRKHGGGVGREDAAGLGNGFFSLILSRFGLRKTRVHTFVRMRHSRRRSGCRSYTTTHMRECVSVRRMHHPRQRQRRHSHPRLRTSSPLCVECTFSNCGGLWCRLGFFTGE